MTKKVIAEEAICRIRGESCFKLFFPHKLMEITMPIPNHCIECDKPVMDVLCDKCKEKERKDGDIINGIYIYRDKIKEDDG